MRRHLTAALLVLALTACDRAPRSEPGHEGHDHGDGGHERESAKTDPHHAAGENHSECEDDVSLSPDALARYGIEVAPVRELSLKPTVSAPGHLAFPQGAVARVGCPVAGRIAAVSVRSGDEVAPGDVLLAIDSPALGEAQSDYLQKRTVAATAGPTLELAKTALARAKEVYEKVQGVTLSDVQRRETELRQLERDLEVARSAEAAARHRLLLFGMSEAGIAALEASGAVRPRLEIAAPIAGRVVEIAAALGELVGPEKDRLVVVGDGSTLWAVAEVSESRLAEVAAGAPARVRVPALGAATFDGRVAAKATVLDASTRTAEVRVEVPNPDGTLLPGMFIQVEIESSRHAGVPVVAVPDEAVLTVEGRPSVFIPLAAGSGTFCKHAIEIGPPVGSHIPVLSGLKPGELVVVAGTFRLKAEHGKASAEHEH